MPAGLYRLQNSFLFRSSLQRGGGVAGSNFVINIQKQAYSTHYRMRIECPQLVLTGRPSIQNASRAVRTPCGTQRGRRT